MSKNQQMYRNKLNEIKGNHNTNLKPYPPLRWLLPLGQITVSHPNAKYRNVSHNILYHKG